jgi:hypothetical protein
MNFNLIYIDTLYQHFEIFYSPCFKFDVVVANADRQKS